MRLINRTRTTPRAASTTGRPAAPNRPRYEAYAVGLGCDAWRPRPSADARR